MEETKTLNKIIIDMGGDEYVFEGGGGGSQPAPNSVGTEELKDGAVEMQDLHDDVKGKIQKVYDEDDEALHMDFDERDMNKSNSGGSGGFPDEMDIEEGD